MAWSKIDVDSATGTGRPSPRIFWFRYRNGELRKLWVGREETKALYVSSTSQGGKTMTLNGCNRSTRSNAGEKIEPPRLHKHLGKGGGLLYTGVKRCTHKFDYYWRGGTEVTTEQSRKVGEEKNMEEVEVGLGWRGLNRGGGGSQKVAIWDWGPLSRMFLSGARQCNRRFGPR